MSETRSLSEPLSPGLAQTSAEAVSPPADGGKIKATDEALVELLRGSLDQISPSQQTRLAIDYCRNLTVELVDSYFGPGSEADPAEISQMARDLQLGGDFLQTVGQIFISLQRLDRLEDTGRLAETAPPELRHEIDRQAKRRLARARWIEQKTEIEELLLLAGNGPAIQAILNDSGQFDGSARRIIAYHYLDRDEMPRAKNSAQLAALLELDCETPSQVSVLKRQSLKRLYRLCQEAGQGSIRDQLELAETQDRVQQLSESGRHLLNLIRRRRQIAICERLVLACRLGYIRPTRLRPALRAHLTDQQFKVLDLFYGLVRIDDMTFNMVRVAEAAGIKHQETATHLKNIALGRFYDRAVVQSDELQQIISLVDSVDNNLAPPAAPTTE